MTPSIHKSRESPFLLAVAVLLFLGMSAYLGAFLFDALTELRDAALLPVRAEAESTLWGVAVRRERVIGAIPAAPDGRRLTGRGVYFASCDGYESLEPEILEDLDASALSALRERKPGEKGEARLVEDTAWFFAALYNGQDVPVPGPCRLRFAGFANAVPARLLEVRGDGEETLLLFRLTEGGDCLRIRFSKAEIERS